MSLSSHITLASLLLAALAGCDPADAPDASVQPRSAVGCGLTLDADEPGDSYMVCQVRTSYPCLPHQGTTDEVDEVDELDELDELDEEALCMEVWLEGFDGTLGVITRPGGRATIAACDDDDACSVFADGEFRCELGTCVAATK